MKEIWYDIKVIMKGNLCYQKTVRDSALDDKRKYIEEELGSGSWHAVKKLRAKATKKYLQM